MISFPCPACSKPCHPKATECRWCRADLKKGDALAEAAISPSILKELEEIRAWKPSTAALPGLFSFLTLVLGLMLAALGGVIAAFHKTDQVTSVSAMIPAFVLLPLFLWSLARRDLSVLRSRRCGTPGDAVAYYCNRVARRMYGRARLALADHASAQSRHASLKAKILQGGKAEVHEVAIRGVRPIGNDFAAVLVEILMRESSRMIIPLPGLIISASSTADHVKNCTKLVVLREDRWYLVNGLLIDRVDQSLLRCLSGPQE